MLACGAVGADHHGYKPFGELKYPPGFEHFDYVNPDAPKGGTLRLMGHGSFDSLNPWIMAGARGRGHWWRNNPLGFSGEALRAALEVGVLGFGGEIDV